MLLKWGHFTRIINGEIDPLEIVANIRGRGLFWGIEFCKINQL